MSTTADALPEETHQGASSPDRIPLRERPRDWFFIVIFVMFASTSFLIDLVQLVGRPDPHSTYFMSRFVYNTYGAPIDPMTAANPRYLQVLVGVISALVFGLFYVLLIYAFIRGREWIRRPAFIYAGMLWEGTAIFLSVGLLGDAPLFRLACGSAYAGFDYKFSNATEAVAVNLFYPLVAALLVARMWRPHPFTRRSP